MDNVKLAIKSTDLIILRSTHSEEDVVHIAQDLHNATGALVLILSHTAPNIEQLSEEEARKLWVALSKRFANDG